MHSCLVPCDYFSPTAGWQSLPPRPRCATPRSAGPSLATRRRQLQASSAGSHFPAPRQLAGVSAPLLSSASGGGGRPCAARPTSVFAPPPSAMGDGPRLPDSITRRLRFRTRRCGSHKTRRWVSLRLAFFIRIIIIKIGNQNPRQFTGIGIIQIFTILVYLFYAFMPSMCAWVIGFSRCGS